MNLLSEFAGQSAIIFTRTVNETQRLAILLRALGFGAIPLHGQLSQSARLGALGKFRARSRDILVATDVAARGLDIPSVDIVVNFDLPPDSKTYIHRVGRTARAGKSGHAISLVTQYDVEVGVRFLLSIHPTHPLYKPSHVPHITTKFPKTPRNSSGSISHPQHPIIPSTYRLTPHRYGNASKQP